jgi:D-alanine-D-alanine ligase
VPDDRFALTYDRRSSGVAREIECSVPADDQASLPGEVFPHNEFYDYADKYLDGKTRFAIPAVLPAADVGRSGLAVRAGLDAAGMARVDFLEAGTNRRSSTINTIPGHLDQHVPWRRR